MKENRAFSGEVLSFTGLSTDDKPQFAGQGAIYHSVDTGEKWVYNEGMWVLDLNSRKLTQSVYE